jgi:hypothetical protein
MIALIIKMGSVLFPGELGVRFVPLLLNFFTLLVIEKLITPRNSRLSEQQSFIFYAIALSAAAIQVAGFWAVPDTPLIFFTALFFWCYKLFLERSSLLNTFLLGLAIACLFYSKYHAVLVVFFTLLSNLKLFTRYQLWLAGAIGFLLFLPHLWWQYDHDWISFRYHLFESNVNPYKIPFTADYILGQLLLPGPVAGFILVPAAFLYKPADQLEKALRYTMIGIYVFFFISTFRGRVEANWTSPVLVSVFVLAYGFLSQRIKWRTALFRTLPFTLALVLFARVIMIWDIFPSKEISKRFHAWKGWPKEMRERTKDQFIVFSNSYQRASKYWFYSGQTTYSLNWYRWRKNNYNLWPIEDSMLGKPVYYLDINNLEYFPEKVKTSIGELGYRYDPSFVSFGRIHCRIRLEDESIGQGEELHLYCRASVPLVHDQFIRTHNNLRDSVRIAFFNKNGWVKDIVLPISVREVVEKKDFSMTVSPDLPGGLYYFRLAFSGGVYSPTHNSDKIKFEIK